MNYYLVDPENVRDRGLMGADLLEEWYRKTGTVPAVQQDKWVPVKELKRKTEVPAGLENAAQYH